MNDMVDSIVVLVTAPDSDVAANIARVLVGEHLAACANIVPGIRSIYFWEGAVQDEGEVLMIIKTRRELFDALSARVTSLHPYSMPEVVALPIVAGAEPYMKWLADSTER